MTRRIGGILALGLGVATPSLATVHHVPADFATIGAALAAAGNGDVVQVAPGTYATSTNGETFPLTIGADVHLSGAGMGLSILDAQGAATVVKLDVASGGRVSGFTITGGHAGGGGGVRMERGDAEIDHNLIVANGAQFRGAGIYVLSPGPAPSTPWIHRNVVWANFDTVAGDAVDPHGIVTAGNALGVIENNLIGRTDGNGTLTSDDSQPAIRQNIFFENGDENATPPRGRGICWLSAPPAVIYHNLFHANVVAAVLWMGVNVSGVVANDVSPIDLVYGNLDGDPLFVDVEAMDFRLQGSSPAIDAGDPALPFDPDGTIADIGPFWFDQSGVSDAPIVGPDALALSIAPNPFRPATGAAIRWSMPRAGTVSVEVVDVSGRRVRSLFAGPREVGGQEVRWDGRTDAGTRAASGAYLALVRVDGVPRTAPMLLLR